MAQEILCSCVKCSFNACCWPQCPHTNTGATDLVCCCVWTDTETSGPVLVVAVGSEEFHVECDTQTSAGRWKQQRAQDTSKQATKYQLLWRRFAAVWDGNSCWSTIYCHTTSREVLTSHEHASSVPSFYLLLTLPRIRNRIHLSCLCGLTSC